MVRQFLSILLAFLFTLLQFPSAALADIPDPGWSASVPTTTTAEGIPMPDWSRISFASLPPIQEGGTISIPVPKGTVDEALFYNLSRSWQAGTPLADVLTLGDLQQDFGLEKLSLEAIAQKTGMDLSQVSLESFSLIKQQTISSLVAAIPGLGNYSLEQVKPLAEVVEAATGKRVSWQSQSMAPLAILPLLIAQADSPGSGQSLNAVASDPNLGQQSLSSANLIQHSVNDIPGLSQTSLGEFDGWQQQAISQVPGLANVSFNATPNSITDFLGFIGIDDVTYGDSGDKEHTQTSTTHSITGSDRVGFNYECAQERSCAYLELVSPAFLGNFGSSILHGAQWIKGGTDPGGQMVDGGHGVLGAVNGGKEPTGRLPFGPSVKVVLTGDNESDGSGSFGLYFRVCHSFLGCTPYFIGPVPFYRVHEKGVVIVGLTEMEMPSGIQQPDTPSDVQSTIDQNDPGTDPGTSSGDTNNSNGTLCGDGPGGVNFKALGDGTSGIEGNYGSVGQWGCDGAGNCGRGLGRYQFMTYRSDVRSAILSEPGGEAFYRSMSSGSRPSSAQMNQYFGPAVQDRLFKNAETNNINSLLHRGVTGDALIACLGEMWYSGRCNHSSSRDYTNGPTVLQYGQRLVTNYHRALQRDGAAPCTTNKSASSTSNTSSASAP